MRIGIMGAMIEEVDLIIEEMVITKKTSIGNRDYFEGTLCGVDIVLAYSRWGKVASASTVTTLINLFNIDFLLFTGVCGAVHPNLDIGDIIIAKDLYQHDMDASPLVPRFQIPLTQTRLFSPCLEDLDLSQKVIQRYLHSINESSDIPQETLNKFSITNPKVILGTIATGDQFVSDPLHHESMLFDKDQVAHAVEMEGAAVAQVCEDYGIGYLIVRVVSDKADHSAHIDFQLFIKEVSSHFSRGIACSLIPQLIDKKACALA